MDISVIIVSYNTKDMTLQCIKSIYEHTINVEFEVILVDNASVDNTVDGVKEAYPMVTVIENNENVGFGKANNVGVQYASGKYLFFLNSDTLLLNNALFLYLSFFEKYRKELNIGCLGSILYDMTGNVTHSFQCFPTFSSVIGRTIKWYLKVEPLFYEKSEIAEMKKYIYVDYITGADLFMPKKLFTSLNGFNPSFFMYYEETYLQYQVHLLGLKRYIIDTPRILHLEGASYENCISNKKRIDMDRSLFLYLTFRYSRFKVSLFRPIYFFLRLPILFRSKFTFKENLLYLKSILNCKVE